MRSEFEEIEQRRAPILQEVPGEVERITKFYNPNNAATVLYSYAARPKIFGCSGALVGPELLLTANHCVDDYPPYDAKFRVYQNQDIDNFSDESFSCDRLIGTWGSADFKLWYCDPNSDGVSPGDKYGYLDLFGNQEVSVGDELYKIWQNNVAADARQDVRLFSEGTVTSKDSEMWFVPPNGTGVRTNLWSKGGTSGSAFIEKWSTRHHHIVAAPQSTGLNDGKGSNLLDMYNTMYWVKSSDSGVNDALVTSLGLDPSAYKNWLDVDLNYEIDIMADLMAEKGLSNREIYWLGFKSKLRHNLWNLADTTLSWQKHWAAIVSTVNGQLVMEVPNSRINLKPNNTYRVHVSVRADSTTRNDALKFYLWSPTDGYPPNSVHYLDTTQGQGWTSQSFTVQTGPTGDENLRIRNYGDNRIKLSSISISEEDATWDFDSYDARFAWMNQNTGKRALITEDGQLNWFGDNETGADWAANVWRDPSLPVDWADWSVRNARIGLEENTDYRICFSHRNNPADPLHLDSDIAVRVSSGGSVVLNGWANMSSSWGRSCYNFTTGSGNSTLMFGTNVRYVPSPSTETGSWLVDNVRIYTN
ncbi:MAG: hypothetical protein Tsb0020_07930 [Haliangiales bacterium]